MMGFYSGGPISKGIIFLIVFVELTNSFLIGGKRTEKFRKQRL